MEEILAQIQQIADQTGYPLDAFLFVQRGLDHTVRQIHGEADPDAPPGSRHISGQVLCQGLREYAVKQYGLLALSVLKHWNIASTDDFGRIVFAMIDGQLMQKTDHDTPRDFAQVYEFGEVFSPTLQIV